MQMDNFPTWIPDCDSHGPTLLYFFLCSTMVFPPLRNSDNVVSVSIDFPSNCKHDVPFHCIAYDYSCGDHLIDVPWDDILMHGMIT